MEKLLECVIENPFPHWWLHPGAFRWIDDPMFVGAKQAQQQVPVPEFLEPQEAGYSVSAATTCVLRALWGWTLLRGWRKPAAHRAKPSSRRSLSSGTAPAALWSAHIEPILRIRDTRFRRANANVKRTFPGASGMCASKSSWRVGGESARRGAQMRVDSEPRSRRERESSTAYPRPRTPGTSAYRARRAWSGAGRK